MHRPETVAVCADDGWSGTLDESERPGLLDALTKVQNGEADALVVQGLDRLARALHVQEAVLARVWDAGGRVLEVVGDREVLVAPCGQTPLPLTLVCEQHPHTRSGTKR